MKRAALNIDDLRRQAKCALPRFAFSYVEGGADDEQTLQDNREVFGRWRFIPPVLNDSSQRDLSVTVCGQRLSAPLLIAPTGYNGMLRFGADTMLARTAKRAGIAYIQSTVSTASLEEIAAQNLPQHWFQLYVLKDRTVTTSLLERARAAGCTTLVVSVDAVHFGNREKDKRNYRRPMKLSVLSMIDVALHPGWVWRTLKPAGMPGFGNLKPYVPADKQRGAGGASYFSAQMDTRLNWETLRWIRSQWQGALLIKGILAPEDAQLAFASGADGIVLSNHGGRQLDGSVSALEVLPEIRKLCGSQATILIDSGFRRGTDVVKALALGADAVLLGRPMLYGVAAAGEAGAQRALEIILQEVDRTMAQLGCTSVRQLGPHLLRQQPY
ncbi:(S)-mandelate dehydrogenase [Rahnella aceris]|uniref:(S)-mandelate dehydrogenase n=1 Tax=Rahnella sp. (strain Y9602) TaxID=2703885 RepID=A0A0H3FFQ0_RAHSY|nr:MULTISPECIES: alpha-hydroxy acid oxidase [Rahnella]AFE58425.1 (S)-mandelate dehydrogenase [Rahnella aquatilis HX2]MQB53094.1 alpha-hydroxy-acid oxidizing protein [Rahnella sp. RcJ3]QBJ07554.1 alpha-hydroxy-acid oxidizing protein [Rahnella aquatilis]ADW73777.1 (S)-mandelate dehydrogenase [Rahnella aceris]MBU9862430.1 alpha-hydroxy-acid oxidizing protein [Rahnella aceris]